MPPVARGDGLFVGHAVEATGRKAPPRHDPTHWAEMRKQKIERAEKLRAEQRARLQAMGQLPLDCDSLAIEPRGAKSGAGGAGGHGTSAGATSRAPGAGAPPPVSRGSAAQQREPAAARVQPGSLAEPPPNVLEEPGEPLRSTPKWEEPAELLGLPPQRLPAAQPRLRSPERRSPEQRQPERPERRSPERPERRSPERPERRSPERSERRVPEQPERRSPERPERRSPERPERRSPERPERWSPERPEPPGLGTLDTLTLGQVSAGRRSPGKHTQQDLAKLFQHALAMGACHDLSPDAAAVAAEEQTRQLASDSKLVPSAAELTIIAESAGIAEVTLPPSVVIAAVAAASAAAQERPREAPVAEVMPSNEATMLAPRANETVANETVASSHTPAWQHRATRSSNLTELFDIAYQNHSVDTGFSEGVNGGRTVDLRWEGCTSKAKDGRTPPASPHGGRSPPGSPSSRQGCSLLEEATLDLRKEVPASSHGLPRPPPRTAGGGRSPSASQLKADLCNHVFPKPPQRSPGKAPSQVPEPVASKVSHEDSNIGAGARRIGSAMSGGSASSAPRVSTAPSVQEVAPSLDATGNGFRIIEYGGGAGQDDGSAGENSWWAKDDGPAWLRSGDGPAWLRKMHDLPSEDVPPVGDGPADAVVHSRAEPSHAEPIESSSDATFWPDAVRSELRGKALSQGASAFDAPPPAKEASSFDAPPSTTGASAFDAPLSAKAASAYHALPSSKGAFQFDALPSAGVDAYGPTARVDPYEAPPPSLSADDPLCPNAAANAAWLSNLRGGDEFVSEDPLVFGAPKRRARSQKRRNSKPAERLQLRVVPDVARDDAQGGEAEPDEASAWMGNLRGGDDESFEDLRTAAKPRDKAQPLQPRRAPKRPPRPDVVGEGELGEASSSGARGSTSRPHSRGNFSSKAVIGQQMPEAMRRRLDARSEQRDQQREQQLHMGKPGREEPSCPTWHSGGRLELNASGSCDSGEGGVRLPPLEPDCLSRGRRCSSQPPVDHVGGGPSGGYAAGGSERGAGSKKEKKKSRPQSLNAGKEDDDEKCGRQMFDKNTLRTNHRELFMAAIRHFRSERCHDRKEGGRSREGVAGDPAEECQMLSVYLRKRPIFEKEERVNKDYDVATTLPGSPVPRKCVLHSCLFQADLKTPYVQHLTFEFDRVFDESCENEDVYHDAAAGLVKSARNGGVSTMFMFGQTGSGKTHTMTAIQESAARDLFQGADGEEPWLSLQFIELRGNRCFDLLAPSVIASRRAGQAGPGAPDRPELRLREQTDGTYSCDGAVDLFPRTPEELCVAMQMAQSRRATSATDANAVSSRSHAVCTIRLFQSEGQLLLVDCAGTERRKDSMYHSKERQQEGAEINASLHALKECIRHLVTLHRVPSHAYRASSLTKVLADAFMRGEEANLAVICTTSPCATDTEHTIATMRMGMALGGRGSEKEEKQLLSDFMRAMRQPRLTHPKQWTAEQVCEWLGTVSSGHFQDVADAIPSNFTGQMLVRLTEGRCVQLCGGSERRGRSLFDVLHQEIQRVVSSHRTSN